MKKATIPSGYQANSSGHLVPIDNILPLDKLRDDLVIDIIQKAHALQIQMATFKASVIDDIDAFMALSSEEYGIKLGGKKGNLSLFSYNAEYKIMICISEGLVFDERLVIAKALIDQCIHEWTKDSGSNVKALIEHAFQTDKAGNINTARVLGLFKLKIEDATWKKAMEALKQSITVNSSKRYLRFYERAGEEGTYQQISLDIASIELNVNSKPTEVT